MFKNFLIILFSFSFASLPASPVVGIMAVNEQELGNILPSMEQPVVSVTRGMRTFYKGKLWGHDSVVFLSNVGKAAAASATVDLIGEGVDAIIFIGTAGALDERLNIGDIVLAKRFIDYDIDFSPYAPLFATPNGKKETYADPTLLAAAYQACCQLPVIDKEILKEFPIHGPKVVDMSIGTTDSFLITEEKIKILSENAPDVAAIEMEGASIGEVAERYAIPYILIRTIPNHIKTPNSQHVSVVTHDYFGFLQKVQSFYTEHILKELFFHLQIVEKQHKLKDHREECLGILCRAEKEAASLCSLFSLPAQKEERGGRTFYSGSIGGRRVVVVPSGFGKTAAASAAAELILFENCKTLIAAGHALSTDGSVKEGDMVISASHIESDMDVRPFIPRFQDFILNVIEYPSDQGIVQELQRSALAGQMASGDQLLNEADLNALKQQLPQLLCYDTESAAASKAAFQYSIPFVAIRAITPNLTLDAPFEDQFLQVIADNIAFL